MILASYFCHIGGQLNAERCLVVLSRLKQQYKNKRYCSSEKRKNSEAMLCHILLACKWTIVSIGSALRRYPLWWEFHWWEEKPAKPAERNRASQTESFSSFLFSQLLFCKTEPFLCSNPGSKWGLKFVPQQRNKQHDFRGLGQFKVLLDIEAQSMAIWKL